MGEATESHGTRTSQLRCRIRTLALEEKSHPQMDAGSVNVKMKLETSILNEITNINLGDKNCLKINYGSINVKILCMLCPRKLKQTVVTVLPEAYSPLYSTEQSWSTCSRHPEPPFPLTRPSALIVPCMHGHLAN